MEHHDRPHDFPAAWIREETLAHEALDGVSLEQAIIRSPGLFAMACTQYAAAVAESMPTAAAADRATIRVVTLTRWQAGLSPVINASPPPPMTYRQPATLAVANGPDFTLALVLRNNTLDVVDVVAWR